MVAPPNAEVYASNLTIKWFGEELYALNQELNTSLATTDRNQLQQQYRTARQRYKHIEFFVEYFYPRPAKFFINGPLVPKYDEALGNLRIEPNGFQRIEEILFASTGAVDTAALYPEIRSLQQHLVPMFSTNYYSKMGLSDGMLLEMCQIELHRIATLNLNGYDATITKDNVIETKACLEGIQKVIGFFGDSESVYKKTVDVTARLVKLSAAFDLALASLGKNTNYDSFDRLAFIREHISMLNLGLIKFHQALALPWTNRMQALDLKQSNLFSKAAYNPSFFAPYNFDTTLLEKKVALGRLLFFDPILSGDGKRSCASCHNPDLGFGDGQPKSIAMDKNGKVARNAPPLFNLAYANSFFDDGRAFSLEEQVSEVLHNKVEMRSSLKEVCEKLKESEEYQKLFAEAFAGNSGASITANAVQRAIAVYERTLTSVNSRFDQYLAGNEKALTAREHNGYNLFAGKALCGSCHFLPLFSGITPPFYGETEFEVIGTPESSDNKTLDADSGRCKITKRDLHLHAFKTPTVRNIAETAPYMHNGAYTKLEDVVEFYHKGGGVGLGFNVPNQTLPFDSLTLNATEKQDIVLFMKSLSDVSAAQKQKPKRLPSFGNNATLNARKIGGEY
jgi:cytochrome c peroxidase